MEANNDHKFDGPPKLTKPLPIQQHAVNNNNNSNMMINQEAQAPSQQTPLDAAAQPIVEQEALNGQLEDVEAKDDNKDRDSDNNNKDNDINTMNWLNHETEGKKTTKKWNQGLFGSLP